MQRTKTVVVSVGAAAVLLLSIYVGSYLALVLPNGNFHSVRSGGGVMLVIEHYRYGGRLAETAFAPLERIDRKVRPNEWR